MSPGEPVDFRHRVGNSPACMALRENCIWREYLRVVFDIYPYGVYDPSHVFLDQRVSAWTHCLLYVLTCR